MGIQAFEEGVKRTLLDDPPAYLFEGDQKAKKLEFYGLLALLALIVRCGTNIERLKKRLFHNDRTLYPGIKQKDEHGGLSFRSDLALFFGTVNFEWDKQSGRSLMIFWNVIGLVGEVCELAYYICRYLFARDMLSREMLVDEMGDVLWYMTALAIKFNIPMGEAMDGAQEAVLDRVMQANIDKLKKRYPQGFTDVDSLRRVDVHDK